MKKLVSVILILLLVLALFETAIQSHWGKQIGQKFISKKLKEAGWIITVEDVSGTIPHAMHLKNVHLFSDEITIRIESLQLNLSLWGLFNKEITFTEMQGRGIVVENRTIEKKESLISGVKKQFPFSINVKHFKLEDFSLLDLFKMRLEGKFSLKEGNNLSMDTKIERLDFPETKGLISLKASLGKRPFKGHIKGQIAHANTLFPKFLEPWTEETWKFSSDFRQKDLLGWQLSRFKAVSHLGTITGEDILFGLGEIQKAHLKVQTNSPKIHADIVTIREDEKLNGKAIIRSPSLLLYNTKIKSIGTDTRFSWDGTQFEGNAVASGEVFHKIWTGKADFSWKPGEALLLPSWDFRSASIEVKGNVIIRPDTTLLGSALMSVDNLQDLSSDFYGSLALKSEWKENTELEIDGKISNFYWKDLFAQSISFYSDVKNLREKPEGNVYLDIEWLKWRSFFLETTNVTLQSNEQGLYPFQLLTEGEWKHPLQLNLNGLLDYTKPGLLCKIEEGNGSFFNHPIALSHPVDLKIGIDLLQLPSLDLTLSDAQVQAQWIEDKQNIQGQLILQNFPLDVLSLNPLDLGIEGRTNIELNVQETKKQITGDFKISIDQLKIASLEESDLVKASGMFEGSFNQDRFDCKGSLRLREAPLLSLNLSVPIHLETAPLKAELLYDKSVKGDLIFQGQIEEILDFFDLGTHYLRGKCACDFHLKNTLNHPKVEGYCHFENGHYENYFTGTQIDQIKADWRGEKDRLILDSLIGKDKTGKGEITAQGEIQLNHTELLPFHFDVDIHRFTSVQIDLVTAETNGKLKLDGNLKKALATGSIEVVESDLMIPSRVPKSYPRLEVVYLNATQPIETPKINPHSTYPLNLNLSITAPDSLFITGRGLDSEWRGDFQIEGSNIALAPKGKLELVRGNFVLSGRTFKLTEGALLFSGRTSEMPYLNLAATMDVKDISIIARLKGPLNDPQITLQSVPPLPLSTIMAYLLFGQNLAEINSYQALQLANSVASLLGEGPDVLESTRRSLGVDQLNIVTTPSGDDELGDRIAVQVGKYISEGILVSLTQGAEESSTNISIEIELKSGFVLQFESDQQQEQGKFTFKWNHNY